MTELTHCCLADSVSMFTSSLSSVPSLVQLRQIGMSLILEVFNHETKYQTNISTCVIKFHESLTVLLKFQEMLIKMVHLWKKNSNKTEGVWQTKDLCSVCKRVAKDLYKKNKKHKINFFLC